MSKVVIVVLVLIAVLFVVFIVVGAGNHSSKDQPTAANINQQSIVGWLGPIFGSRGPKLDAAHMRPALTTFDLQKQSPYAITVLADENNPVRQAEFIVTKGHACAHLLFNAATDSFKRQDTDDPNNKPRDPNDITLSIPKQGGSLIIQREGNPPFNAIPCTVTLK